MRRRRLKITRQTYFISATTIEPAASTAAKNSRYGRNPRSFFCTVGGHETIPHVLAALAVLLFVQPFQGGGVCVSPHKHTCRALFNSLNSQFLKTLPMLLANHRRTQIRLCRGLPAVEY